MYSRQSSKVMTATHPQYLSGRSKCNVRRLLIVGYGARSSTPTQYANMYGVPKCSSPRLPRKSASKGFHLQMLDCLVVVFMRH